MAKATFKGGAYVFGGLLEGLGEIAAGFGKGVTKIVDKKYGHEAGLAIEESEDIIREGLKIEYAV